MKNDKPTLVTDYQFSVALSFLEDEEQLLELVEMKIKSNVYYSLLKEDRKTVALGTFAIPYGNFKTPVYEEDPSIDNTKKVRKHKYPWYKQIK